MLKQIIIQIPCNTFIKKKEEQTLGIHNNCGESPRHYAEVKNQFPKVIYFMIPFT